MMTYWTFVTRRVDGGVHYDTMELTRTEAAMMVEVLNREGRLVRVQAH